MPRGSRGKLPLSRSSSSGMLHQLTMSDVGQIVDNPKLLHGKYAAYKSNLWLAWRFIESGHPLLIRGMGAKVRGDHRLMLAAYRASGMDLEVLRAVHESLRHNPDFVSAIPGGVPSQYQHLFAKPSVHRESEGSSLLESESSLSFSDKLDDDSPLDVKPEAQQIIDKETAAAMVQQNVSSFFRLTPEMQRDHDVAIAALIQDASFPVDESLFRDPEFVLKAYEKTGRREEILLYAAELLTDTVFLGRGTRSITSLCSCYG